MLRRYVPFVLSLALLAGLLWMAACSVAPNPTANNATNATGNLALTAEGAEKFLADAEKRYSDAAIKLSRASWVKSNFITDDTEVEFRAIGS